ncbi:beta-lactamase family protein [Pelomonas sp. P7]|uniref:Beta-lactamase family protein n=1 Tax=Pelomonas caseinilytica TaxID=2906763 RepID=A0ABS8XDP2_9BURK|nr:serine hydrolase domain-containing protein [Pelomonas sp. P7]MCE4536956.1 beta-lactamase family protein [Pelomonas sp. P7]
MTALLRHLPALAFAVLACGCAQQPLTGPAPQAPQAAQAAPWADATAGQAARFAPVFDEVDAWVAKRAFPGAVLAVGVDGRLVALKAFGRLDSSPGAPAMPVDAVFDLASLTKVVATTTAIALLCDQGLLKLDEPVVRYLPEFAGVPGHERITVRHLLAHNSGLPSPMLLWKHAGSRAELLDLVYRLPVQAPPGAEFHYRDENFILLGEIVQRVGGLPLDRFVSTRVFEPLGMAETGFNPPASLLPRIPATEQDEHYRHRLVRGTVHDENADVMGGVAGHAGLFSTAADLARLAEMILDRGQAGGRRFLSPQTLDSFLARQHQPPGSSRALGWDTPEPGGLAGPRASADAVLHTGFTGTSLYIDRSRRAFVVLLTNRVNPSRDNKLIGPARTAIHSAVLQALDAGAGR